MNIGFDLDKIFIDHPPLIPSWLITKLYGEKVNGHLSYRIPGTFEQYIRQLSHVSFLRRGITKNIAMLKEMSKISNIHLFLISSRYGFLEKQTKNIMEKNHLTNLFTQISFNFSNKQPHLFKDTMITKQHIDRFVDDDLPLLQFLATRHPHVLFFWLNASRNDKLKKNLYAITRLSSVIDNI